MGPDRKITKYPRAATLAAGLFWLAVWQLAARRGGQKIFLPSPLCVLESLGQVGPTLSFWGRVGFSLLRIAAGFGLAAAVAVMLAGLAAAFPLAETLLRPLMLVVKATPVASFVILALVWMPSRQLSVFISFLMVLPIVYAATLQGIRQTDRQLLEMAKVFRLSLARQIRAIYLPGAFPYFSSACSAALGLAWKSGIAAEVIGLPEGSLGEALYQAKIFLVTDEMFAWTLTVILASMAFEKLVMLVLRRLAARISGEEGRP